MLADLGADVIKVERPQTGDDTRHWGPPWIPDGQNHDTGDSAYFSSANRNKRSIAIDISCVQGQALIRDLAREADILVENYKVGDLARYGLDYSRLREVNPALIYCSVTGYGQDGPYADRPGYDFIFQAEGGLMSITGEADDRPGGGPLKTSIAVTDVLAGLNATIAILAALEHRRATGEGQHIDIALLDTIVNFGANQIASYFASGEIPRRWGNEHPNLTPYQSFETADGHLIVGCGNDGQYRKFCAVIERPDLATDPRYRTMEQRNVARRALQAELAAVMSTRTTAAWIARLEGSGVPNGPINDYAQVFQHPQVVHRDLRVDQPHAAGGVVSSVRNPIRLSATPIEYRLPPPVRGQQTRDILRDVLALSAEQIAALERDGVVQAHQDPTLAGTS